MAHIVYLQRSPNNADPWTTVDQYTDSKGGVILTGFFRDAPGAGPWYYRLVCYADPSYSNWGKIQLVTMVTNK